MTHQCSLGGASVPFRPVQALNTRCCSSDHPGVPSTETICAQRACDACDATVSGPACTRCRPASNMRVIDRDCLHFKVRTCCKCSPWHARNAQKALCFPGTFAGVRYTCSGRAQLCRWRSAEPQCSAISSTASLPGITASNLVVS